MSSITNPSKELQTSRKNFIDYDDQISGAKIAGGVSGLMSAALLVAGVVVAIMHSHSLTMLGLGGTIGGVASGFFLEFICLTHQKTATAKKIAETIQKHFNLGIEVEAELQQLLNSNISQVKITNEDIKLIASFIKPQSN